MKKKSIGIAILAIILVSGLAFAVDVCITYSTNPTGAERRGIYANLSGVVITVESSIREPVKIIQVKIGEYDYTWTVTGEKRISPQGSTTLTLPAVGPRRGNLLVRAESCD